MAILLFDLTQKMLDLFILFLRLMQASTSHTKQILISASFINHFMDEKLLRLLNNQVKKLILS